MDEHARDNARNNLEYIIELVEAEKHASEHGTAPLDGRQLTHDDILRTIYYDPLESDIDGDEFTILLSTGGPACRIAGTLDRYGRPDYCVLEYQDWFTPWTRYTDSEQYHELLEYSAFII